MAWSSDGQDANVSHGGALVSANATGLTRAGAAGAAYPLALFRPACHDARRAGRKAPGSDHAEADP